MSILTWFKNREKLRQIREAKRQELFLEIKEAIIKILALSDKNDIPLATRLVDDLGVDSFKTIELAMELEEKFDIEILDDDAEFMRTVKDIVDYLEKKISGSKTE